MDDPTLLNFNYWSRRILLFYLFIVMLSVTGEVLAWVITRTIHDGTQMQFFVKIIVRPTLMQLTVIGLTYAIILVIRRSLAIYALVLCGIGITMALTLTMPNVHGLELALLLPMAVSLIFFRLGVLMFSFVASLFCYMLAYVFLPVYRDRVLQYESMAYTALLCAGYIIYYAVLQREVEVMGSLRKAIDTEQELDKLARTDSLTGLYNHRTFQEELDRLVAQGNRGEGEVQLAIVDIDHFKRINDNYGHHAGDAILRRVARAIAESVTASEFVARYGGEEFAILFSGKTMEEAFRLMEHMRVTIGRLRHPEMEGRTATISGGLQALRPGVGKAAFFAQADALLYEAKRGGRNRIEASSASAAAGR
ncbi:GGDEF domain-containing protein [Paenibacillus methanolicus]|uniref:GGDEF domain-containing protein n=1 Tax=Paenibacillus methanolicus TaxID=582686 RepID=UPI00165330B0|nr:GGDEF domain-containing protein [Paenibacillus methanolicus]